MHAQTRSHPSTPAGPSQDEVRAPRIAGAAAAETGPFQQVPVWDAPTRVVHWLLAAAFVGAFATAGQDGWRWLHETLGATIAGLAVFRIAWGFAGTRHARFASFVRGPRAVVRCLRDLPHGWAKRHIGHSPAGAVLLIAMLLLAVLAAASGWARAHHPDAAWLRELHGGAAQAMLALAGLHIVAVVFGSWRSGENLPLSMIRGTRLGVAGEGIRSARRGIAWLVVAAVLAFWVCRWMEAGDDPGPPGPISASTRGGSR
jgi:cytochrome b